MRPTLTLAGQLAFSVSELTQVTGLGRSKLYEEIGAGRLRARKAGARTLVLAADLNEYLQSLPEVGNQQEGREHRLRGRRSDKQTQPRGVELAEPVTSNDHLKRAMHREEPQPEEVPPTRETSGAKLQIANDDLPELPPFLRRT